MGYCLIIQPIHDAGKELLREEGIEIKMASAPDMTTVRREIGGAVACITRNAGLDRAAMEDLDRGLCGVQFHPEVAHTRRGQDILKRFLYDVCSARPTWTRVSITEQAISSIRAQVGDEKVICGLSGGVDSAVAAALSVSGLPADRFTFLGFLPRRGAHRRSLLATVANSPWTVVLFESPRRLVRLLADLTEACGADRWAVVTRELTKVHEEVKAGTLADLSGYYCDAVPKGEITVLVARQPEQPHVVDEEILVERAREMLAQGESRRDVATRLAKELNVSRNDTYRVITKL